MKSGGKLFRLSRSQWISVAVLASSLGVALALTVPNTFTAGTSISATQMNANFTALETAINNPILPTLYTGIIPSGQPVITTSFDRSTWQVMGVVTPPAGEYFIIARVNGQTESTSGTGAYTTTIDCELLLEPTVPRPRLDFVSFSAPAGTGGSIEKFTLTSYVTVPAGGSVSLRCRTGGTSTIPASTMIGAGGHIDAIPVGGQVNG